jgi:hypothetical protein
MLCQGSRWIEFPCSEKAATGTEHNCSTFLALTSGCREGLEWEFKVVPSDTEAVKTATFLAAEVALDMNVIVVTASISMSGKVASRLKEILTG